MKKPQTKYQIIDGILDDLKELIIDIEIKEQHIKAAQKVLDSNNKGWYLRGRYTQSISEYRKELKYLKNKFNNLRIKLLPILEQW